MDVMCVLSGRCLCEMCPDKWKGQFLSLSVLSVQISSLWSSGLCNCDHAGPGPSFSCPLWSRSKPLHGTYCILHSVSYCSLCHRKTLKWLTCSVKRPKPLFPSLPKHHDPREGERDEEKEIEKEPVGPCFICLLIPPCAEMSPGS